jgi:hypothetical protein
MSCSRCLLVRGGAGCLTSPPGETAMWELAERVFFQLCIDVPYPAFAAVF